MQDSAGETTHDIAIVGGGFAGAMTMVQLARTAPELRVVLFDGDAGSGRGVAYGTHSLRHLLNVPAGKMSAFPDDPEHFWRWANAKNSGIAHGSFVARKWYGEYVSGLLQAACANNANTRVVAARVTDLQQTATGWRVRTSAADFTARAVLLALGNHAPGNVPNIDAAVLQSPRYIASPWKGDALGQIGCDDEVLVIGSGLTAIDVLLSLEEQGMRGGVHLLSRRGLLPLPHRAYEPAANPFDQLPPTTRALTRLVRAAAATAHDWRSVVDTLRPLTQSYWQSLSLEQRRRFLRHVRPFWEAHRHRVAPEVISVIDRFSRDGMLTLHKARLERVAHHDGRIAVSIRERLTQRRETFTVDWIVNCTGPESNVRRVDDPLIRALLERGTIVLDALSLGIETTPDGAVVNRHVAAATSLFAIGSARKGALYETTAVPELRVQAAEMAGRLAALLQSQLS